MPRFVLELAEPYLPAEGSWDRCLLKNPGPWDCRISLFHSLVYRRSNNCRTGYKAIRLGLTIGTFYQFALRGAVRFDNHIVFQDHSGRAVCSIQSHTLSLPPIASLH